MGDNQALVNFSLLHLQVNSFRERGLPETKGSKRPTMLNSQAEAEMLHTLKSNRGPTKGDVVSSYTRL